MKSSNPMQPDNQPQEPFEQRARELWRAAARQVDPATARRLRTARHEALQAAKAPVRNPTRWLIPTGAVAAVALAAMVVWQPMPHAPLPIQTNQTANAAVEADAALPPDAEQADPALYQNLDFYAWLASNDGKPVTR
ncbi:MAG: hypothetical protein ABI129_10550 [Rhodanobacter sp.]